MAKAKPQSTRSRAAKRAVTPDASDAVAIEKVVESMPATHEEALPAKQRVHYEIASLSARGDSGIQKPKLAARKKALSAKARKRMEASQDRAEAVMEQMAKKVQKRTKSVKIIKDRRGAWDEINQKAEREKARLAALSQLLHEKE
ncbi:hypothetical protein SAICODRAFT_5714 [Saitoella complicata NRRL Y-17804]|uniref:Uncharacterized protein n=1 Tax=Saitoella complicata (strain BCRC 22490 / CBS 7301 / JCM 7358 / NBRC 10748 / NRRL Y-17804) TaxID=698492 RepID=A0A0E9NJP4_SAICN|nr:uncharacterized protein SAICODRAFT_5714 [Saitoella complicata NRRL Y-17804]ODQ55107.1 hypothetical protein SAICODRAFT_5714 [Saitoella complicata NRRL Y-17804]GAO50028.1 hypothetical protein G7K_4163-t1 [Saitoella complicata NRRL Y-17804]